MERADTKDDLIAFGRMFISNPGLLTRLKGISRSRLRTRKHLRLWMKMDTLTILSRNFLGIDKSYVESTAFAHYIGSPREKMEEKRRECDQSWVVFPTHRLDLIHRSSIMLHSKRHASLVSIFEVETHFKCNFTNLAYMQNYEERSDIVISPLVDSDEVIGTEKAVTRIAIP
ncbi:hypothetical protein BDZ97DRAFT_1753619 [Flammula alnicola]|nr:hypothetical protein BDZ97DRAFT_1753619 [Flammula alnicola]